MEKEGLVRTLEFLKKHGLSVEVLVTDRHRQIASMSEINILRLSIVMMFATLQRVSCNISVFILSHPIDSLAMEMYTPSYVIISSVSSIVDMI